MDADNCSNALILYEAAISEIERRLNEVKRVEQLSTAVIKLRLGSLQKAADSLQTAASEYYKEINGRELVNAITRTNGYLSSADNKISKLTDRLAVPTPAPAPPPAPIPVNPTPAVPATPSIPQPKLPQITIPTFDGKIEQWYPFWTVFKAVIHDRQDMNDVIKFTMLNSYLKGKARETVEGLAITPANYTAAISLLKTRFSNVGKLEENLRNRLLSLPHPEHDAEQLMDFLMKWNSIVHQLDALPGIMSGDSNEKAIIKRCLSKETLQALYQTYNTCELSVDQLRKGIEKLIERLGRSNMHNPTPSPSNPVKSGKDRNTSSLLPNATSVNVNSSRQPSSTKSGRSRVDNKPIETAQSQPSFSTSQKSVATSNQSNSQNNVNSNQVTVKNVASLRPTALPTATLLLSNDGNRIPVRAFLVSGSQRTFINPDVVEKLNLVPIKQVELTLIPFGDNVETKMFDVVRVIVRAGTKRIKLNEVVCNHVNTSIHTPGLHNVYLRLQERGVKLADKNIESDTLSDIGLIIGADYYNAFVYCHDKYDDVCLLGSTAGAVIFGPIPNWACNVISDDENVRSVINTQSIVCSRVTASINPLDGEDISRLWSLDTIGIGKDARSYNDQAAIEHFNETIVKTDNKYTIDLPFKSDARPPTGYRKALGQLYSLKS
ncbi:uncharacterized protein LOC135202801 [Macrobrachium nipponense]|uniref:uncharacterized protein LOC135202801 n=1 Tax=Macrobrachium nipponense TaxID=159736 RepID=UPI0030C8607F